MAVRGFSASKRASTSLLNAMAALRALIMQHAIHSTCSQRNGVDRHASKAPVKANGSANTEWLNRTSER